MDSASHRGEKQALTAGVLCGGLEVLEQLTPEWSRLCDSSPDDLPFYRPEWTRAYIRAFEPGLRLTVFTARRQGRMVGILPLAGERSRYFGLPVRKLRAPFNRHLLAFSAVTASEEGERAIDALWMAIAAEPNWDLLELPSVRENSSAAQLLQTARQNGYLTGSIPELPSPYLTIPRSTADLGRLPRNARLRTKLRQITRELSGGEGLAFRSSAQADQAQLREFYELEASGWKGRENTAIISDASTRRFYDELVSSAANSGYLRVYELSLGNRLIAGHLGLRYRGRYFSPKVAFREDYARYAPGHLIMQRIAQDCFEQTVSEIDITGAPDDWKSKWTSEAHRLNRHLIFRNSPWGRVLYAAGFQLKPLAKRCLQGLWTAWTGPPGAETLDRSTDGPTDKAH